MGTTAKQTKVLERLNTLLSIGEVLYADYLDNGKTKSRARLLKQNCERIRDLLLRDSHKLKSELQPSAMSLLHHSMCFVSLWETYDAQHSIAENQEFSYPTEIKFPSDEVDKLLAALSELRLESS